MLDVFRAWIPCVPSPISQSQIPTEKMKIRRTSGKHPDYIRRKSGQTYGWHPADIQRTPSWHLAANIQQKSYGYLLRFGIMIWEWDNGTWNALNTSSAHFISQNVLWIRSLKILSRNSAVVNNWILIDKKVKNERKRYYLNYIFTILWRTFNNCSQIGYNGHTGGWNELFVEIACA